MGTNSAAARNAYLVAPGEQGHGVDVRVAVHRDAVGVNVGHRVVAVVLVLPPRHGEALVEVAEDEAEGAVDGAVGTTVLHLAELVVAHVVGEPAGLLPAQPEQHCADDEGQRTGRGGARRGRPQERTLRRKLVRVVPGFFPLLFMLFLVMVITTNTTTIIIIIIIISASLKRCFSLSGNCLHFF